MMTLRRPALPTPTCWTSTPRAARRPAEQPWTAASLNLVCSALSPTATHIACSTPLVLRLYRLVTQPLLVLQPVREASVALPPASALAWSGGGGRLVVGGLDGRLVVWDVAGGKVEASVQFPSGRR